MKFVAALALLVQTSFALNTYDVGSTPNTINGVKILKGYRGDKPFVTMSSIYPKLSFAQDPDFDAKLAAGNISTIKFTQNDVDLIAQASPLGEFDFYSEYPVITSAEQFEKFPSIENIVPKDFKPKENFVPSRLSKREVGPARLNARSSPSSQWASILAVIPELDLFYTQNVGDKASLAAGSPVSYRTVYSLYSLQSNSMYQLTYATQDSFGNANIDLATVFVPDSPISGYFATYDMHEDGDQLFCAYSYLYRLGLTDTPLTSFLDNKFPVSVVDYEGPNSAFGAGYRAAKSTLDSIRAVRQSASQLGLGGDLKSFLYGYSAGATVAGLAAEILNDYASDLSDAVVGLAVGGYVTNYQVTLNAVNKQHFAGLIPMMLGGLMAEYPTVKQLANEHLTTLGNIQVPVASAGCSPNLYLFLGQDMNQMTDNGMDFWKDDAITPIIDRNTPGKVAPPMPVFFLQTTTDEVATLPTFEKVVDTYCQGGAPVTWHKADTDGHGGYENHFPDYVPQWMLSIVQGTYSPKTCSNHDDVVFV